MKFERNIATGSQKCIFLSVKVTIDAENTSFSYLETFITVTVSFAKVIFPIPIQAVYNLHFQIFFSWSFELKMHFVYLHTVLFFYILQYEQLQT